MSSHPLGRPRRPHRHALVAGLAVAVVALAGCSSPSSDSASQSSGTGTDEGGGGAKPLAGVEALYTGTYGQPPAEAPTPEAGKKLFVIPCGQQATACADAATAAGEAAEAVGWTSQACDGKLNPAVWSQCIRQGVAAKADGVLVIGIDCAAVQQSLVEATAAGVPVVGVYSADCDDPSVGGEPLFAASTQPSEDTPTIGAYYESIATARAEWIIEDSQGKANVVEVDFQGNATGAHHHQGFVDGMEGCSGCTVAQAEISNDTLGNLRKVVETALLKNPEATYVVIPLDALTLLGGSQAVAASPRRDDITVVAGEGAAPVMDLLRARRGVDVVLGQSAAWGGYAGVDTVIRTLAGEGPVAEGLGFQLLDRSSDIPAEGGFETSTDFRAAYLEAWGAGA